MTRFQTQPLTTHFGVEVTGLDVADAARAQDFPLLRAVFEEHAAILSRDQTPRPQTDPKLAGLFGPIEDRKADERKDSAAFEIPEASNVTRDGGLTGEMDLHTLNLKCKLSWHSDSTVVPVPALTNILTAHGVTKTGGATGLASTRAAFADMPPARRAALRNMVFRHRPRDPDRSTRSASPPRYAGGDKPLAASGAWARGFPRHRSGDRHSRRSARNIPDVSPAPRSDGRRACPERPGRTNRAITAGLRMSPGWHRSSTQQVPSVVALLRPATMASAISPVPSSVSKRGLAP